MNDKTRHKKTVEYKITSWFNCWEPWTLKTGQMDLWHLGWVCYCGVWAGGLQYPWPNLMTRAFLPVSIISNRAQLSWEAAMLVVSAKHSKSSLTRLIFPSTPRAQSVSLSTRAWVGEWVGAHTQTHSQYLTIIIIYIEIYNKLKGAVGKIM